MNKIFLVLFLLFGIINANVIRLTTPLVKLSENNFVVIRGPIDGTNSAKTIEQLIAKQNETEVYIYITTNGGSVMSGLEIIRTMQSYRKSAGVSLRRRGGPSERSRSRSWNEPENLPARFRERNRRWCRRGHAPCAACRGAGIRA